MHGELRRGSHPGRWPAAAPTGPRCRTAPFRRDHQRHRHRWRRSSARDRAAARHARDLGRCRLARARFAHVSARVPARPALRLHLRRAAHDGGEAGAPAACARCRAAGARRAGGAFRCNERAARRSGRLCGLQPSGAGARRDRRGQGAHRAAASHRAPAVRQGRVRGGELRCDSRWAVRVAVLRPHEGLVHGCRACAPRVLRAGHGGHVVPRRDR
ncbi:hypothetical protein D3C86_1348220 [compost metagenome]